jgi:integrase
MAWNRWCCMFDMPRPRPPYLRREVTRHGSVVWYVRRGEERRVRIRAAFGTLEFDTEYRAALEATPRPAKGGPGAGSITWLINRYQETCAWTKLSRASQRQRQNMLTQVIKAAGNRPFTDITKASLETARDRRSPAQGRKFLDVMRGLFRWAVKAGIAKIDPTTGVANPPALKTAGFHVWSEDDVAAYEARWPVGTRQRVWFDVLLYTGLRRGYAVKLGRQHVRDGVATLKTEKTDTEVTLPILPVLAQTLAAGPCGDLAFIAGESGRPLTKESFGNLFRDACHAAGLQNRSAHGLRKAAATRAANAGATVAQLEAIFGWSGGSMASLYTRSADRRRLAMEAMSKLANESGKSIAAPSGQVRLLGEKRE